MIKKERVTFGIIILVIMIFLFYEHKQIVNSRGIVFKQQCEDFSIHIFSEQGRHIMVQEFNPTYDLFGQEEEEIIKTANETVNQLGKVIFARLGNGSVGCNVEKKVILKNFTREEVIKEMVEFVAENQKNLGYNFTTGNEPKEVCEMVTNNYNTGL